MRSKKKSTVSKMPKELIKLTLDNDALSAEKEWIEARDQLISQAQTHTQVATDDDLNAAGKLQTTMAKTIKALGKLRLAKTSPANVWIKALIAKEKDLVSPLVVEVHRIKAMNSEYATKKAREAEEERKRIEAEDAERAMDAIAHAEETGEEFRPDMVTSGHKPTGKISTDANRIVERWHFEITNSAAVPRELCSPDPKKIRAYVAANKDQAKFTPGVKVWATQEVEAR